jgi:hypothetical protein
MKELDSTELAPAGGATILTITQDDNATAVELLFPKKPGEWFWMGSKN